MLMNKSLLLPATPQLHHGGSWQQGRASLDPRRDERTGYDYVNWNGRSVNELLAGIRVTRTVRKGNQFGLLTVAIFQKKFFSSFK